MYLVKSDNDKFLSAVYTINQLQVVGENIKSPDAKVVIRGEPTTFIIEKILDKKTENRTRMYFVKWKGYDDTHNKWEPTRTFKGKHLRTLLKKHNKEHP